MRWRALDDCSGLHTTHSACATLAQPPHNTTHRSLHTAPSCNAVARRKWQAFYNHPAPYEAVLPGAFQEKLSAFQRLVLLRCLLPDKLVPAISVRSPIWQWMSLVCPHLRVDGHAYECYAAIPPGRFGAGTTSELRCAFGVHVCA